MAGEKEPSPDGAAEAAPAVDSATGEISVPLDGRNYMLRPSYKAIKAIERQTRPLFQLVLAAERIALPIEEQAIIVTEMMHAYGEANPNDELAPDYKGAKAERVGELIYEVSGTRICARLLAVLDGALNGGYTASGEAKPAETTTT